VLLLLTLHLELLQVTPRVVVDCWSPCIATIRFSPWLLLLATCPGRCCWLLALVVGTHCLPYVVVACLALLMLVPCLALLLFIKVFTSPSFMLLFALFLVLLFVLFLVLLLVGGVVLSPFFAMCKLELGAQD
jgi:hypothetical protein